MLEGELENGEIVFKCFSSQIVYALKNMTCTFFIIIIIIFEKYFSVPMLYNYVHTPAFFIFKSSCIFANIHNHGKHFSHPKTEFIKVQSQVSNLHLLGDIVD